MARAKKGFPEAYYSPFATRLRELMAGNATTQDQLAGVANKTRQTISQYVNGISEPGYDTLVKFADFYGTTTDYLLGRTNDPSAIPSAIDELGLSPKAVDVIERMSMIDTPSYQLVFRSAACHVLDILNCLLESPYFAKIIGNLLICFDSYWIQATSKRESGTDDREREEEINATGHVLLSGDDAARFYANEAGNSLKELICKELPILVDSCIKDK